MFATTSWVASIRRDLNGGGRSPVRNGSNRARLAIEMLEDRSMPSVTFFNPGTQNNFDNEVVNLPLMASSSTGNPLSFSEVGLPAGLGLTNNLGIHAISGTIAGDADLVAPYYVAVTATDTVTGEYDTQAFTWNVSYAAPTAWGNMMALDVLRRNLTDPIDLAQYASGGNGNPLQFSITAQPTHGELNSIGGSFYVYMSDASYTGQDSFQFQATDGRGVSNTATFTINVTNAAPTVTDTNTYYVLPGQTITLFDLGTYGTSASSPALTASLAQQAMSGQALDLGYGLVQYTAPNFVGSDMFGFRLNDGVTDSSMAYAHISVVDQPIAANDGRQLFSGLMPVVISSAELTANAQSTLSNPTFSITSVGASAYGQLVDNNDGTWTYTPPEGALAGFQDSFTVTLTDGVNNATANYTLLVPDRRPYEPPAAPRASDQRLDVMRNVTTLFPVGLTVQAYNLNPAYWDYQLAASVHQGFVAGDSVVGSTIIGKILRGGGFAWLNEMVTENRDAMNNNVLVGYRVGFNLQPANTFYVYVRIPTEADRRLYGASFNGTIGASLWYTVYEMAYAQQFRVPIVGPIQLLEIGDYLQPRPTATAARDALVRIGNPANGAQSLIIANMQQNALIAQLGAFVPMTAFTFSTFTPQQQQTATNRGIDAGHSYAIIGFANVNGADTVTLINPHNRPGLAGGQFTLSLADFQQLFSDLTAPA